ncbi:MAG: hypothetical protein GWQ08_27085 [Verrucomicrobiaceae bacterium]|nr:hypothetical protein [Verrucomicrobiaceae bacterium]
MLHFKLKGFQKPVAISDGLGCVGPTTNNIPAITKAGDHCPVFAPNGPSFAAHVSTR